MTDKQIKKLKEVKKDRITWTGSILLSCIIVCILCLVVGVKAILGLTVDFLKDVEEIQMPNFVGLTREECENLPELKEMLINYEYVYSNTGTTGEVLSQSVEAGKSITNNQTITLKILNGSQAIRVPNTVDLNVNEATAVLNNLGLNYKLVYVMGTDADTNENSDEDLKSSDSEQQKQDDNQLEQKDTELNVASSQTIVSSDPKEFSIAKQGDTVTLYVARPYLLNVRVVPDLIGKWWNEAEDMMAAANISNYKIFYIASDGELNKVVSVWPTGQVNTSETVYIKVSGGPTYGMQ